MKRTEIAALVSVALLFIAVCLVKIIPGGGERSCDMPELLGSSPDEYDAGDMITGFGAYKGSPLNWTVLDRDGDCLLLVCTESIDIQYYDPDRADVTWETSFLREWMNGPLLNEAFSVEEQAVILPTLVTADPNPEFDTDPGCDTEDRLFLLSIDEVLRYFPDDLSRQCPYHGLDECYWWWLRSPGKSPSYAARVRSDGTVDCIGYMVENRHAGSGIRPVMWVSVG